MTTGSLSEREGVVYVTQDQGFFRKHGVDVSFVQVRNGPVAMAALSSGETHFHWGSVSGANLSQDLSIRLTGIFVANPKIQTQSD